VVVPRHAFLTLIRGKGYGPRRVPVTPMLWVQILFWCRSEQGFALDNDAMESTDVLHNQVTLRERLLSKRRLVSMKWYLQP